jgi:hypothetical protein
MCSREASRVYIIFFLLLLGLNSEEEAFDIVLFAHPESVQHIPSDCTGRFYMVMHLMYLDEFRRLTVFFLTMQSIPLWSLVALSSSVCSSKYLFDKERSRCIQSIRLFKKMCQKQLSGKKSTTYVKLPIP